MFTKNKVFAYENSDGDKGIIIARSIDEAEKIFHKKYPERKIVDNYYDYCKNGAYLFEMSKVDNNKLYCCFPWWIERYVIYKRLENKFMILKEEIRSYLEANNLDVSKLEDLVDEYESEQTFALYKDGSFEMITGNTVKKVRLWLHKKFCL